MLIAVMLQVVNAFFSLVGEICDRRDLKILFFDSYFMAQLLDESCSKTFSYKNVERRTLRKNVFAREKIALPVYVVDSCHWILLTADMMECRISVYDSLSIGGMKYAEAFLRYLREEAISKTGCSLDELTGGKEWSMINATCPQQDNSFDCGVFMCIFLECYALNIPIYITRNNVEDCREKIGGDLLRGKLSV
jgi:Ulp1 family protease